MLDPQARPASMKKALVTGGAGFIGSHLVDALLRRNVQVVVVDDLSSGNRENLPPHVTLIEDDVRNIERHRSQLEGVDTVFHLAALISGHDSLLEPEHYWDANMHGLLRVIHATQAMKARIVFASSSTVYGDQMGQLSESRIPSPTTAYAATKIAGEHTLSMFGALFGFSHVSLRLFNVYGPRQNPDHPYANVTCKFAKAGAEGTTVKLYGDGHQTRDFVFVDDVVNAFLAVAEASRERVYNVGTGRETSIRGLLDLIADIRGAALDFEQCQEWPNDIRSICADTTRLTEELGWVAETEVREGLSATVDFFRGRE